MAREGIRLPSKERLWSPLTENEMDIFEGAAFRILKEVGIYISLPEVLKIAKDAGGEVDAEKQVVKFPEMTVRDYLSKAPRTLTLAARNPKDDLLFNFPPGRRTYTFIGATQTAVRVWDEMAKEYVIRDSTTEDVKRFTSWQDALEACDFYVPTPIDSQIAKEGLPAHVHEEYIALNYNTRHISMGQAAPSSLDWDYYARLAAEVVGGIEELRKRPIIDGAPLIGPPLSLNDNGCYNLLGLAKYGLPMWSGGANSPTTILNACQLTLCYATAIGSIVLDQAAAPNVPVLMDLFQWPLSMRYANMTCCAPEALSLNAAGTQLLHERLGLPVLGGGVSASKLPDEQAIYETALDAMYSTMCGTDLMLVGCGTFTTLFPESLLVADEIVGYMKQFMKRYDDLMPTAENIAFDMIKEVGPLGNFLMEPQHIKNLELQYKPKFSDYRTEDAWLKDKTTMMDNVRKRMKELDSYEPPLLPKDVNERMKAIVQEADSKLKLY